ncbi:hypothetical protein U9M48_005024, partial [Paspalum notatum var. saurae]
MFTTSKVNVQQEFHLANVFWQPRCVSASYGQITLLSLMGAYAAGTCRDTFTKLYSSLLVGIVFAYLVLQMTTCSPKVIVVKLEEEMKKEARLRKVLMVLATFAVSIMYVAGLSTPGGFWGSAGPGHSPGDAILKGHHNLRLAMFFAFNTTAFVASLLIIVVLMDRNLRERNAYGLIGAYTAGSCREIDTTFYVVSLEVVPTVGVYILFLVFVICAIDALAKGDNKSAEEVTHEAVVVAANHGQHRSFSHIRSLVLMGIQIGEKAHRVQNQQLADKEQQEDGQKKNKTTTRKTDKEQAADKARSLVLLLSTLAATITFQAGLVPPGGVWQDNDSAGGHMAGDPILLTTNGRRYKAFFYCNSVAFVASLVAIVMVQLKSLLTHHVIEVAMILDLFGLIGAYAAGSCRDVTTSVYAMALAGAVLVYVVVHVILITLDHDTSSSSSKEEEDKLAERTRKRLLLFAILAATITYQAGLTPPGGFLQGDHAGDPVLLYNFPRRYKAFFYCNSVSFMLSIVLILLLLNPNLYRPAIRSHALSVCTAAGLFGLMGAYAARSTQHLKTSLYIFVLCCCSCCRTRKDEHSNGSSTPQGGAIRDDEHSNGSSTAQGRAGIIIIRDKDDPNKKEKRIHAKRKYLMLLGILVASVTYQAGLEPPGGAWQVSGEWYEASNPVMHDNRRLRYLAFFYSNSTSFMASIVVILLLLVPKERFQDDVWRRRWLVVMNTTVVLDLLGLLGAYAAGSIRSWKTSAYVVMLVIGVLAYMAFHLMTQGTIQRPKAIGPKAAAPPLIHVVLVFGKRAERDNRIGGT